jgi:hypothetical protein
MARWSPESRRKVAPAAGGADSGIAGLVKCPAACGRDVRCTICIMIGEGVPRLIWRGHELSIPTRWRGCPRAEWSLTHDDAFLDMLSLSSIARLLDTRCAKICRASPTGAPHAQ